MKTAILALAFFSFLLLSIGSASALEAVPGWTPDCINSTTLLKTADIYLNNTSYYWNQTIHCPFGCNENLNTCWKWPGEAIPSEYFMLLEIVALGIFFLMLFRADENEEDIKMFDVIMPMIALILFASLALQSNNVIDISTGEAVRVIPLIYLNLGFSVLSLVFFFLALFKYFKNAVT